MLTFTYKNKNILNVYYHEGRWASGLTLIETLITLGLLGAIVPIVFILSGSVSTQYAGDVLLAETFLESQTIISKLHRAFDEHQPVLFHDNALFIKQGSQELLISNKNFKISIYATSSLSSTAQERLRSSFVIGSTTYEVLFEKPY